MIILFLSFPLYVFYKDCELCSKQTWGQFHFVDSNSTLNFSIPFFLIIDHQFQFWNWPHVWFKVCYSLVLFIQLSQEWPQFRKLYQYILYYFSSEWSGRLRRLAVACWTTDHYHPCSDLGVGISEGCFTFDFASLRLEVARLIRPTMRTKPIFLRIRTRALK